MAVPPIFVPVEPSAFGAPRPPAAIDLPLECRPKRTAMGLLGLFFSFWAVAIALAALAGVYASSASHARLFSLAVVAVCLSISYLFAVIGFPYVVNALRPGPALVIDADGLDDRRLNLRLRWDEVAQAQIRPSRVGFAALALRTHRGAERAGRFHAGLWWRGGDQIVIPVQFLMPSPGLVALLMATLVERAGGEVEGKPYWAQEGNAVATAPPLRGGRSRPIELIVCITFALMIAAAAWADRQDTPRLTARAQAELARSGHPGADVRRDRWINCSRASTGFDWRTATHEGYACLDRSDGRLFILRAQPRRHAGWI
jgi:hypothetical protein